MLKHAREGYERTRQVRTALRGSTQHRYVELCLKCSDGAMTLAQALGKWHSNGMAQLVGKRALPMDLVSRTHANAGDDQKGRLVANLYVRGQTSLCNHSQWAWLCDPDWGDSNVPLPPDKNYAESWLPSPHLGGPGGPARGLTQSQKA